MNSCVSRDGIRLIADKRTVTLGFGFGLRLGKKHIGT
jgi:hypothetical protein